MASKSDDAAAVLATRLEGAGKPVLIVQAVDGARLLVLPHGGRVLGVYPATGGGNFLWMNPALDRADTARALFDSEQWCNTGGDRSWIAPESDFFLPHYPEADLYHQPRAFDPGSFTCHRDAGGVVLSTSFSIHSYRTAEEVGLALEKRIEPLDPKEVGSGFDADRLALCGYSLRCALRITSSAPHTPVGLWNLLQLPHGGVMLFGVKNRPAPVVYFGSVTAAEVTRHEDLMEWTMSSAGEKKIGLTPRSVTGRVAYVRQTGENSDLIVRDFSVDPSRPYIDAPRTGTEACTVQACSISGNVMGSFCELEYHSPAIGGATNERMYEDLSTVRCFRGPRQKIQDLAERVMASQHGLR